MNDIPLPDNGTERLAIRLMERRDIEEARLLHNDDETLSRLSDISHVSEMQQEAWFQSVSTSKATRRYVARRRVDGAFVGVFRLDRLDPWNRNALVGADVAKNMRGQGYATEMYRYVLDYLFNQVGLHRVGLVTLETNTPAIGLYRKLGFVDEGVERQAIFRDGRFQGLVAMGLLAEEWQREASFR
jgi:RimJ/RimL family protein N-acetyltransferase